MATERLKTIKSSGGDYTSLSAAEAGEDDLGDLVSRDEWMHFSCYAIDDTTAVDIDGWTTDATRFIQIDTPSGARHSGVWDGDKYNLVVSNQRAIGIYEKCTRIFGLQIHIAAAGASSFNSATRYLSTDTNQEQHVAYNILRGPDSAISGSDYHYGVHNYTASSGESGWIKAYNNIIYNFYRANTSYREAGISRYSSNRSTIAYNNTIYHCNIGIWGGNGAVTAINNIVQDCYGDDYRGSFTGSNYNISSDATSTGGANDRTSRTVTFVDAASRDLRLSPSDTEAINNGTSDPGSGLFGDDILGTTRSGSWDIGAYEYVVAGGLGLPLIQHYYNQMRH